MSTVDVAEVCTRHGLLFGQSTDGMWWCETPDQNPGVAGYPSAPAALCALLKALYGIHTFDGTKLPGPSWWHAVRYGRFGYAMLKNGSSELGAVVDLADLLIGVHAS